MKKVFFSLLAFALFFHAWADDKYEIQASHPRIILTKEGELSLRFLFLENEGARKIQASLKKDADALLNEKAGEWLKTELTPEVSHQFLNKISTLTLAFRIFEDNKYANKSIELLMPVCNRENWDQDPLIVADLVTAVAIGYDWLYYYMNREVRETFRNNIVRKGLNPALELMQDIDNPDNALQKDSPSFIAYSSAMAMGALAVADFFPDLKNKILYLVLTDNEDNFENISFSRLRDMNANDWDEDVNFLAMMLSSLNASLGHDFNISLLPNMRNFASDYLAFVKGNQEVSQTGCALDPAILYFGKLKGDEQVPMFYTAQIDGAIEGKKPKSHLNYMCLAWMME